MTKSDELEDLRAERDAFAEEAAESLRLLDWLAKRIGVAHDQELTQQHIADWLRRCEAQAPMHGEETPTTLAKAALDHLTAARDLSKRAGCSPRLLAKIRLAISSAKGAVRHAEHRTLKA